MKQMSDKRAERLRAAGTLAYGSTFAAKPATRPKRARNTGPKRSVRELIAARSGGVCEWPICGALAIDPHHRLNRKAGGRKGEMRARTNGPAWLLHVCRTHHDLVTSPTGANRTRVIELGWLLLEGMDATQVPVLTSHDDEPVWLDDFGGWCKYEEGVA